MKLTEKSAHDLFDRHIDRQTRHTKRAYRGDLTAFRKWCGAPSLGHALFRLLKGGRVAANRLVTRYETSMVKGFARNSVKRRIAALKSFVTAASREGVVDWRLEVLPSKDLTPETIRATAKRDMSGPDTKKLQLVLKRIEAELKLPAKSLQAARDLALIALLWNPMLRLSEVANLNMEDIKSLDGDAPTVKFVGKGRSEPEELPLAPSTVNALRRWVQLRKRKASPSSALFVRVRKAVGDAVGPHQTNSRLSASGIYKITVTRGSPVLKGSGRRLNPHALRHHGITRLVDYAQRNNISFQEATKLSRHKKVETLMQYVDGMDRRVRQMADGIDST
jgi:site-specific recombinase XerC